jgi:hypothetical protein
LDELAAWASEILLIRSVVLAGSARPAAMPASVVIIAFEAIEEAQRSALAEINLAHTHGSSLHGPDIGGYLRSIRERYSWSNRLATPDIPF